MDLQLQGRTALVTGSTAGIGYAVAATLAAEGARVAINGRTAERVEAAIDAIRATHPDAYLTAAPADVGTREGVAAICGQLPEVEILVNSVGIFDPRPFEEIDDAEWQRFYDVNVMSGVRLSRFYLPAMRRRGWGRILFVSSESGIHIPAEMVHYGMTKAAQLAVARGIAESAAGTGVTVNSILPGPTRSEGVSEFLKKIAGEDGQPMAEIEREFIAENRPTSLIKRLAEPQEVANLAVYVCSPLSSATNGAPLRVDGGVVRAMA